MNPLLHPLAAEHLHVVDAATFKQTIDESEIAWSFEFESFTVYHGVREGNPIALVEGLGGSNCAVWYDESLAGKP